VSAPRADPTLSSDAAHSTPSRLRSIETRAAAARCAATPKALLNSHDSRSVLAAERLSSNALQLTGRRAENVRGAERARAAGLTLTSRVATSATFPGLPITSAELPHIVLGRHDPLHGGLRIRTASPPNVVALNLRGQGRVTKSRGTPVAGSAADAAMSELQPA
jgi:hypothetical protein